MAVFASHALRKRRNRFSGPVAKRPGFASPAVAAGISWAVRRYMDSAPSAKSGTHGSGVSLQRDKQVQYVSKHKPGWKRRARRIKGFTKKVRNVIQKSLGHLTTIRDDFYAPISIAGTQIAKFYLLSGLNGNAAGENDINIVLDSAKATNTDATHIMLKSAVLDIQVTTTEATESSCELDVYEFICRKDVPNTSPYSSVVNDLSMETFYSRGFLAQPAVGASGSTINTTTVGVTPFDNKYFCQHFKIIKKTKYLLGLNQYITYQIRDPKQKYLAGYQRRDLIAKKGLTRGVLFIAKGMVAGGDIPATDLAVYTNRHYQYSILSDQTDRAETR